MKMKNQVKMFQTRRKDQSSETDLMELLNLPDREFRVTVLKTITDMKRTVQEQMQ